MGEGSRQRKQPVSDSMSSIRRDPHVATESGHSALAASTSSKVARFQEDPRREGRKKAVDS